MRAWLLLLDSIDEGIYGLDLEGCCTFTNRAGAQMLGYQPEEILGQQMHQFIHHSYADGTTYPASACPISRAFQDGRGIRVDHEVLWRRDGTAFPTEYSAYLIVEQGQITGAVVTFRDITEHMRAEAALRESEERKAAILEAALDAIITIDQHGCIVEFNRAAERMFGYQRAAVVGQELAGLIIPPSLRERHRRGLACYLAAGKGCMIGRRVEFPAMRADGSEFPVELSITQISQVGLPLFTGFLRDLTEREQAVAEERERIARELQGSLAQILAETNNACDLERAAARYETLTKQERAVLALLVQGVTSTSELVDHLSVAENTVRSHLRHILHKLQVRNRTQAVAYAAHYGLVTHSDPSP